MSPKKLGFFQALGVITYCSVVGLFIWQGSHIFPHVNPYFGPVMFLLLFSTSALICALIVFTNPYKLFFAGKKKEAIETVTFTAAWLFGFLVTSIILIIILR